jgi:hypothetical protein
MSIIDGLTQAQRNIYNKEWRSDCKWRRQRHLRTLSFEEFVNQCFGRVARAKSQGAYSPKETYRRGWEENKQIPSLVVDSAEPGATAAKQRLQYSGEQKLLGIGTLHKSSMVPIFDKQSAIDIAQMRRN